MSFPPDFVWGTATAAHQVEGGNDNNQWWRWEHSTDASGKPRVHEGHTSGRAVEHWSRFREDIRRMKEELGATSYRFSIEWSRLEPAPLAPAGPRSELQGSDQLRGARCRNS